jgi:hypothetical protein
MQRIALRPVLAVLGIYHLVLGAVMVLAPRDFFEQIAAYGPYNDHYIRDIATFYLALGGCLLVAVARPSWQVPLLTLALVQYALHLLNHLWDIADSDPAWIGPANVAALALIAFVIGWLVRSKRPSQR